MKTFTPVVTAAKDRAIGEAGGATGLASLMTQAGSKITPQAIQQWRRVPVDRALVVSEITGIPIYELRPDIWGPPVKDAEPAPTPVA